MSITSDEVNFLVYRYLQENGFAHSAFTFAYESLVIKSSAAQTEIPPGALITFLQKGLEYVAIEEHITDDGTIQDFDSSNFSLLSPLICEAVAVKDDRRVRKPNIAAQSTSASSSAMAMDEDEVAETENNKIIPSTYGLTESAGQKLLQLKGHQGDVFMCVWNPVQKQIASGSADGVCRLWGLWDMTREQWQDGDQDINVVTAVMPHCEHPDKKPRDVTSISWSPQGNVLATGCYDGMARIWDQQGNLLMKLKKHEGPLFSLKWNKQGNYVLSGSYDQRAIVWSPESGTLVKSYQLHEGPVLDVDWKDNDVFATCSSDKLIYICKVSGDEENTYIRKLEGHTDEVNAICWSPGGRYLASCSDDSTAKIWSLDEGLKFDLRGHTKEIFTLRWTPTGPESPNPDSPLYLCTASFDGTVKVWYGETGALVYSLSRDSQPVYSLAPSPDGKWLASGSLGGKILIWSLKTGELAREIEGKGDTFDVSWSHDGSLLGSCFSSGALFVLDTSSFLQ